MILTEDIESKVNKLVLLSTVEKKRVLDYFRLHPNDEGKIDWNKSKSLVFSDFKPIINTKSVTSKKKAVKKIGMEGLEEGKDYITCYQYDYITPGTANMGTIMGFSPLNWEASKLLASPYVGDSKTEGKWCIAFQKDRKYWDSFIDDDDNFIIFIDYNVNSKWGKVAVKVDFNKEYYEVFDNLDKIIYRTGMNENFEIDDKFPDFLFDSSKMQPIIEVAIKKIKNAGGAIAEETSHYEIQGDYRAEIDTQYKEVLEVSVHYVKMQHDDGDIVDGGNNSTHSEITLCKIGPGYSIDNYTSFLYDIKFNTDNGAGIYIKYNGDRDFDDALNGANRTWQDCDFSDYIEDFDVKLCLKRFLIEKPDYIIVANIGLDPTMKEFLYPYFNFDSAQDMEVSTGTQSFIIYYVDGYSYSTIKEYVSTSLQQEHDKKMDLNFGL